LTWTGQPYHWQHPAMAQPVANSALCSHEKKTTNEIPKVAHHEMDQQAHGGPQAAIGYKMAQKKFDTILDFCVSSLRRGHANLLCIVPILTDDSRRRSDSKQQPGAIYITYIYCISRLWACNAFLKQIKNKVSWWVGSADSDLKVRGHGSPRDGSDSNFWESKRIRHSCKHCNKSFRTLMLASDPASWKADAGTHKLGPSNHQTGPSCVMSFENLWFNLRAELGFG